MPARQQQLSKVKFRHLALVYNLYARQAAERCMSAVMSSHVSAVGFPFHLTPSRVSVANSPPGVTVVQACQSTEGRHHNIYLHLSPSRHCLVENTASIVTVAIHYHLMRNE